MTSSVDELLARRLLIVTGKGGTGKTTLAATLASLAARRGIDTVLIDLTPGSGLRDLVSKDPEALPTGDGRTPAAIGPHLHALTIDPEEALSEYLELEIGFRPLVRLVIHNAGFRRLLEAAPGWRDLITLGKLWHLCERGARGEPWRLLVVDAPATGHGLSFLSVPRVVIDAVRLGPLRRHTEAVQALLTNPRDTLVVPVTLPEELPVRETLELRASLRELGLPIGPSIVNGVEPPPLAPPGGDLAAALAGDSVPDELAELLDPEIVRAAVEHAASRAALHRHFAEELAREVDTPVLELPFLVEGVEGPESIARLADALEGAFA